MYLAKEVGGVDFVDEVDTHEAQPAGEKRTFATCAVFVPVSGDFSA
jgi:hypothetical protein